MYTFFLNNNEKIDLKNYKRNAVIMFPRTQIRNIIISEILLLTHFRERRASKKI